MTQPENGESKPETFVPGPEVQGLRNVRKAVAANKRATKKAAAKKAPAKKAAPSNVVQLGAKKAAEAAPAEAVIHDADHPWYTRKSYTPVPGQKLYEAIGESGQIAVRSCANLVTHAISWAHVDQPGERAKAIREGVIATFYPDQASAERSAAKFREANPDDRIVVVEAREYRGQ